MVAVFTHIQYIFKDFYPHCVNKIVAGSYCTYAVKFDGSVASVGEGSYGRLGHGGSESETHLRPIASLQGEQRINESHGITGVGLMNCVVILSFFFTGIPIVQLVAGPRVSSSTDEGFALALTNTGDVYSWGKAHRGEQLPVLS